MKLLFATIAMVAGVSVLVFACSDGGSQPAQTQILSRFQTALKDVPTGDERTERARAFAAGTRQDDALFAAGLLADGGLLQEAAPVFARFVVDGGDMTAHFWKWTHGQDPKTAPRAYIAVARALLAQIASPASADAPQRPFSSMPGTGRASRPFHSTRGGSQTERARTRDSVADKARLFRGYFCNEASVDDKRPGL